MDGIRRPLIGILPAIFASDTERLARDFWERCVLALIAGGGPVGADYVADRMLAEWRKRFDPAKSKQFEKDMRDVEQAVSEAALPHILYDPNATTKEDAELRNAIYRLEDVPCALKFGSGFTCTEGPEPPRAVLCGRCNALAVLRKVLAREEKP